MYKIYIFFKVHNHSFISHFCLLTVSSFSSFPKFYLNSKVTKTESRHYDKEKKERNSLYQSVHRMSLAKRCPYLKSIGDFFLSFLAVVNSPVPSADWQQLSNIHSDAASTVIKC